MAGSIEIDPEIVGERVGLLEQLHTQLAEAHARAQSAYATTGPQQLRAFEETTSFADAYEETLRRLSGNVSFQAQRVADAARKLQETASAAQHVDAEAAERLLRLINDASALAEGARQSYVAMGGHHMVAV